MTTPVTPTQISLTIGTFSRTFQLFSTRAPESYDGFGTMTVYASDESDLRYVLIDTERIEWQRGRNGSGLYPTEPCALLTASDLQNRMWEALQNGLKVLAQDIR